MDYIIRQIPMSRTVDNTPLYELVSQVVTNFGSKPVENFIAQGTEKYCQSVRDAIKE